LTCHRGAGVGVEYWSVGVKARVVDPTVLECANCSLHTTVEGALSESVATVSLSTVPRLSLLSRQCCRLRVGKRTDGGRQAVWLNGLTGRAFMQSNDAAIR